MNSGGVLLLVLGRVDFCLGTSGVSASFSGIYLFGTTLVRDDHQNKEKI